MSYYSDLLTDATRIAEEAAKISLSYFRQAILIEMKENHTPVTIADKKAEEMIRTEIGRIFPSHGILGEEFGAQDENAEYVWTVDPIDGTRSFIRGIPLFGTLLGVLHKGLPVVGVMILPALRETYTAAQGLGTFCNGHQLRASNTGSIKSAVIAIGDVSSFETCGKGKMLANAMKQAELCRGYTDCFGHSLVLRGAVDAMIDPIVNIWDVAPLACLAEEANADYFDFDGERTVTTGSFISCAPNIKKDILGL